MSYLRPIGDTAAKDALIVNGTVLIAMVAIPFALIMWDERRGRRRRK